MVNRWPPDEAYAVMPGVSTVDIHCQFVEHSRKHVFNSQNHAMRWAKDGETETLCEGFPFPDLSHTSSALWVPLNGKLAILF